MGTPALYSRYLSPNCCINNFSSSNVNQYPIGMLAAAITRPTVDLKPKAMARLRSMLAKLCGCRIEE